MPCSWWGEPDDGENRRIQYLIYPRNIWPFIRQARVEARPTRNMNVIGLTQSQCDQHPRLDEICVMDRMRRGGIIPFPSTPVSYSNQEIKK